MISILPIECIEVHLLHHSIFIGTQLNIGGIGLIIIHLDLDLIIGIGLDFTMDTIDGHHLDMIDGDITTLGVGTMDMDMDSMIGVGEREWTIMHGKIEIKEMLLM